MRELWRESRHTIGGYQCIELITPDYGGKTFTTEYSLVARHGEFWEAGKDENGAILFSCLVNDPAIANKLCRYLGLSRDKYTLGDEALFRRIKEASLPDYIRYVGPVLTQSAQISRLNNINGLQNDASTLNQRGDAI